MLRSLILATGLCFSLLAHADPQAADAYQKLSASAKQAELWRQIEASEYQDLPQMSLLQTSMSTFERLRYVAKFAGSALLLNRAFDQNSDTIRPGRVKVIHAFGVASTIEYEAAPDTPFTGIFKSGAIGLARYSLALPRDTVKKFVPGLALKFLVDGQKSKTILAMNTLEGQAQDQNYFAHPFASRLPQPTEKPTQIGNWVFERFVKNAIRLNIIPVASVTSSGQTVAAPVAPYLVELRPRISTPSDSRDFRLEMVKIPAGTLLYDVIAVAEDGSRQPIGQIKSTSRMVASRFGDEKLYFEHAGTRLKFPFNHNPLTRITETDCEENLMRPADEETD